MSEKGPYMNAGTNPICEQEMYDCASYISGRCILLIDTKFKRKCPFYKPVYTSVYDHETEDK